MRRLVRELAGAGVARAVGTTGSRRWVERLLRHTLADVEWDVIVAGDDVTNRKPDPEVFTTAVKELDEEPGQRDRGRGLGRGPAGGAGRRPVPASSS